MAQKEVKGRIASVKNIQKITRAMEMIAAARLRKAEQRVQELRDYASAVRRMTRQAADAAGNVPSVPLLAERDREDHVGIVLFTGDRGLAGGFNSQIIRAGTRLASEIEGEGRSVVFFASGRRGISSLRFRGYDPEGAFEGYTDRPAYADARAMASAIMAAYVDGKVDRVEVFYNRYVSPVSQVVTRETLLPLKQASIMEGDGEDGDAAEASQDGGGKRALVEYEPGPEEILERLVPAYVEISIFRSMLESTASEHGARMSAMRNASENASDIISDLTLQMNRERQAEITQEIMEVVAGAESLV